MDDNEYMRQYFAGQRRIAWLLVAFTVTVAMTNGLVFYALMTLPR